VVGGGASPLPSAQSGPRWTSGGGAARATASMGTSARGGSGGGAVPTAAHRQRLSCISIRGTRCIFFLLVPRCFITCCLRVYWISFHDWVLIWSSIG